MGVAVGAEKQTKGQRSKQRYQSKWQHSLLIVLLLIMVVFVCDWTAVPSNGASKKHDPSAPGTVDPVAIPQLMLSRSCVHSVLARSQICHI